MRRVKKACVSSSAIPSWWSTQPSRVTLRPKVSSPMAGESNATTAPPARHLRVAGDPVRISRLEVYDAVSSGPRFARHHRSCPVGFDGRDPSGARRVSFIAWFDVVPADRGRDAGLHRPVG